MSGTRAKKPRPAPDCDFCEEEAEYDGKTRIGPWAYMCEEHFEVYGVGLGTGKGQQLFEDH